MKECVKLKVPHPGAFLAPHLAEIIHILNAPHTFGQSILQAFFASFKKNSGPKNSKYIRPKNLKAILNKKSVC